MKKRAKMTRSGPTNGLVLIPVQVRPTILNVKKSISHYPERTEGSKHARELRERTNHLDDKARTGLFQRAMQRIYASRVKAVVGTGH
jgi:hypothetical protein